jgi:hypothetical protein
MTDIIRSEGFLVLDVESGRLSGSPRFYTSERMAREAAEELLPIESDWPGYSPVFIIAASRLTTKGIESLRNAP